MSELIITADLGRIRAFRITQELGEPERMQEIANAELQSKPGPLSEDVSDSAGRFPRGGRVDATGGMSIGEATQKEMEEEKRSIESVAQRVNDLVAREKPEKWHLAAAAPINRRLVDLLSPAIQDGLRTNLPVDLTKHPIKDIESRFADRKR